MRYLLAGLFVIIAVAAGYIALGPLHYLWADYQDSPTSTYLLFGLPPLAVSVAALVAAVRILRGR